MSARNVLTAIGLILLVGCMLRIQSLETRISHLDKRLDTVDKVFDQTYTEMLCCASNMLQLTTHVSDIATLVNGNINHIGKVLDIVREINARTYIPRAEGDPGYNGYYFYFNTVTNMEILL